MSLVKTLLTQIRYSVRCTRIMSTHMSTLEKKFGHNHDQASITFVGVPAITVVRFSSQRTLSYCTQGALSPEENIIDDSMNINDMLAHQPAAEPQKTREYYCTFTAIGAQETFQGFHRTLAIIAASAVVEGLEIRPHAIIDTGEPLWNGSVFTAFLIGDSESIDNVELTELIPITATEAAFIRVQGAEQLYAAWEESQLDYRNPYRVLIPTDHNG